MIRLRTATACEVRRTLSRIANMVMNDEIETKKANCIIVCCNAILNSLRQDEINKKLEELEELLEDVKIR